MVFCKLSSYLQNTLLMQAEPVVELKQLHDSSKPQCTTFGDQSDVNHLFKGDNLAVLKFMLPIWDSKFKLIYIDPPYNTGNNFDHYNDELSHILWEQMMKDRLIAMKPLLSEDGSIWISIDDNEVHYLRMLCDEVFGRKNFVATIIWQKKYSASNDTKYISSTHDYIIVYAKNKNRWQSNLLPRTKEIDARYKNLDGDPRGDWTSSDLTVKTPSPQYLYPITTPSNRVVIPAKSRSWALSKGSFEKLVADNRIWFGKDGNNMPRFKRFKSEVQDGIVPKTIWLREDVGDNQEAKKEVKQINPGEVFTTPKPERLLERIIELATTQDDWVLDAFAGSGTTGAVAHKLNRKWVLIEINGSCESHTLPRLKRIVAGNDNVGISKKINWQGGGGFTYCKFH